MTKTSRSDAFQRAIFGFFIVIVALNLRPFLAAPGPLLPQIATDTGLGYGALSLLTLLPMLLMGVGAFVSPGIQARLGTRRGLLLSIGLLGIGSLLRVFALNGTILIVTAVICGTGVAFIQSAIPGMIKEKFPHSTVVMTGFYSAMIMTGGAVGAQLAPYLVQIGMPWHIALAWLAAPAIPALAVAWFVLSDSRMARPDRNLIAALMRRPRTWTLMAIFGLINGGYSSLIAWLAPYYQDHGWSSAESASLLATMAISQGIGGFFVPVLARNSHDRRPWLWGLIVVQAIGLSGLAFAPLAQPYLWSVLCGAGLAGTFALGIVLALDHLAHPAQAGALAALMQGGGFLIATCPPFVLARLHDLTGSFASGWIFHLFLITVAAALIGLMNPRHYNNAIGELPGA